MNRDLKHGVPICAWLLASVLLAGHVSAQPESDSGTTPVFTTGEPVEEKRAPAFTGAPAVQQRGGFFSNIARSATGMLGGPRAPGGTQASAAIGIRGLGAEEVRNAQPDKEALQQMESYVVSGGEAASFAQEERLQPQRVQYVTAPAAASKSSGGP